MQTSGTRAALLSPGEFPGLECRRPLTRLAFLGTPAAAATSLRALVAAGHEVVVVVSRPDRRRSRGQGVTPSPVKVAALDLGLEVATRPSAVIGSGAELGVVVAYGELIRPAVLDEVPMVNLHFSLLPRWRGAAPVEWAILAGDTVSGVCLMALDEGLDTGPVYDRREVSIGECESAEELRGRLVEVGTAMLVERLAGGPASLGTASEQRGEPSYAPKLSREDLRLDWHRHALELGRLVRCGRAWTTLAGRRLLVLRARVVREEELAGRAPALSGAEPGTLAQAGGAGGALVRCGTGALELAEVQPEGRGRMAAADWMRGARLGGSEVLGS